MPPSGRGKQRIGKRRRDTDRADLAKSAEPLARFEEVRDHLGVSVSRASAKPSKLRSRTWPASNVTSE